MNLSNISAVFWIFFHFFFVENGYKALYLKVGYIYVCVCIQYIKMHHQHLFPTDLEASILIETLKIFKNLKLHPSLCGSKKIEPLSFSHAALNLKHVYQFHSIQNCLQSLKRALILVISLNVSKL